MENKVVTSTMSQLRQDPISGKWVVIATARGKRPDAFVGKPSEFTQSLHECPFENPFDQEHPPILRYNRISESNTSEWALVVIPNKFPAFTKGECNVSYDEGPYTFTNASGFHELFITRDHNRFIPDLTIEEISQLIQAYKERYRFISAQECINYVLVFHNHKHEAGASIAHPHSQLIATSVIPPDVLASSETAQKHFTELGECIYCRVIQYELEAQKRIVYENEKFVVLAPFASRIPFELRIYPKAHQYSFGALADEDLSFAGLALQAALRSLRVALGDPAYNFFIHSTPSHVDAKHYHWHLEIVPKTAIWAGFEISTGMYISSLAPEDAASFLKEALANNS